MPLSSIPDIYLEILLRVPVKSTFVCKCVCKSWHALISSPSFVTMHCDFTSRKNNPKFMFKGFKKHSGKIICSIDYNKLISSMNEFDDAVADYTDYPFKAPLKLFDIEFLGCFNGVVFLLNFLETLCLWNPATREYKEIPNGLPESLDRCEPRYRFMTVVYGFGYDYKVVYVYEEAGKDFYFARIYTMGSNSWKNIQIVPYWIPHHQRSGVLSNGALHWFGKNPDAHSSSVMISLDMSDEKFKVLQQPKEPLESKHTFISIGELKGCLCVVVEVAKARVEVWVMQDYGVEESWMKRYVITHERILDRTHHLQFMWGFENDEMFFTFGGKLGVYDPKSGSFIEPNTGITLSLSGKCNYFESLASLNSGTYVGGRATSSFAF